jgi:PAS domain S-box-containing protein
VCNRAKDDRLYWVDTVIAPFFDEAGNIDKYVSIRTDVTESRKAQADLAYEREHLKAIISGTNAGTWEWEVPTGEVTINQRWAEIMGYQAHELGPVNVHTWEKFSHPEDLAVAWELLQRHFAGELPGYESEIRMRHREGHWVWVQVRGKVSSWESAGKPRWVSGIHLDITEQKLLQSTLADKNRVMHSMLENIPVALSVFDADLRLVARNEKFAELLDFPASLFDGSVTTFEQIIRFNAARGEYGTVDVEKSIQSIIDRARNTVDHQFERIRPNGVALEVRGAPMPGGGFVTTYADISQRKAAEAEIARTTSLLQSVLHAASEVAVITIGVDHVITLFNKGAERMLGYRSEELVGKATPAILHDASEVQARASSLSAQLGRTVTGLQVFVDPSQLSKKGEWTYVRKNGERFIVSLVVTALSDSQGTCTGYLGVAYDITQEKDNERWLRAAMEEAEQASSAKGQFLANMSHEIRTPMNAILGMLKLLQNTQLDGRQLDYTTKTENAARSLLSLLNDILDFSKIDAGKMQLDPQPFRLDSLMRNLSVILSASIGNKNIEVLFDIDPSVPATLVGDSLRLQQVLINLGGNAIKFTERGEVVLSITLDRIESDTAHIGFAVRDSGIGIAPENQQRIFAGFSQAEASTTRRFGGTGLGLSISRRLVDLMGGELHINSALGEGSTFYFHIALPLAQEAADDALITMPTQPSQSLSVLVVDDNPQSLRVLATMARSLGWTVDTAVGGEEALRRMEVRSRTGSAPYGAVFMDWRMPGMDGWDATLRIRQLALEPIVPIVIMVTAQDRELLAQRSPQEQSRLNGYLVKPITVTMMQDAFSAACDPQGSSRALASRGRSGAQRLAGMRLLVVEDNLINQQVARELLAAEGASVDLAANGQLGVDAVANAGTPYDAVLMDIQMPVMDGYTACVAIRHELGLHALPIIAMTANAMASDREACLAAGMNDHIGKPFDLPLLIDMLLQQTGWQPPFAGATQAVPAVPAALPGDEPWAEHEAVPPPGTTDTRGAIARFGGNTDLYHQILHSYLEELHTLPSRLDVQVQDGQLAEAARTLHTTKGLSLTVGALHMGAIARRAELCLKSSPAPTAAALQAACGSVREAVGVTIEALQTALAQLQNQQPASVERAPGLALDTPALIADLQRLQAVLEQADLQALELHAGIQRKYGAAVAHSMESLDAMIADFEFAQAVVQCGVLMQLFSATPPP